jgi:hypothetical protein
MLRMRTSDRPTIQAAPLAVRSASAGRGRRFRLVQITVLLIACLYADAAMTGGVVRRELVQDAENVWQALLNLTRVHPF